MSIDGDQTTFGLLILAMDFSKSKFSSRALLVHEILIVKNKNGKPVFVEGNFGIYMKNERLS